VRPLFVSTAVLALLLGARPAAAQVVNGRLLERGSDRPVVGASVELQESGGAVRATVLTDTVGDFLIAVEDAGTYRVSVSRVGYSPVTSPTFVVERDDTTALVLRLVAGTILLAPIKAVADARALPPSLAAFYDRVEGNRSGRFITRDRIDQMRAMRASDLMRSMAGMRIVSTRRDGTALRTREGCEPMVFVDGVYVQMFGMSLDDLVRTTELEGVEVYSTSSLPPEFSRFRAQGCGAVLFWTRIEN
jgi:hypothetical protein